jgi:hypothetical protein
METLQPSGSMREDGRIVREASARERGRGTHRQKPSGPCHHESDPSAGPERGGV